MKDEIGKVLVGFITVSGIHAAAFLCCLIAKALMG